MTEALEPLVSPLRISVLCSVSLGSCLREGGESENTSALAKLDSAGPNKKQSKIRVV